MLCEGLMPLYSYSSSKNQLADLQEQRKYEALSIA